MNKSEFKAKGGFFVVKANYGLVVAIMPTCRGRAKISWAILGDKDQWNKKIGKNVALEKMGKGESLPIRIATNEGTPTSAKLKYIKENMSMGLGLWAEFFRMITA